MPSSRKIDSAWFLSDGCTGPVAALCTDVCRALTQAGELADVEIGFHAREAEWVANREWTFETRFEAPQEEDERLRLRFERIYGACTVRLNGADPIAPAAGAYELTGNLQSGENRLQVIFVPAPHVNAKRLAPRIGFSGARLESYSYVRVEGWDVEAGVSRLSVEAFLGGRYQFVYTVSRDGTLIARTQIQERLPAARRQLEHAFDMGDDGAGPVEVLLTIERGGIGCDAMRAWVTPYGCAALRAVEAPCDFDALAELGAQAAVGDYTLREKSALARKGIVVLPSGGETFERLAMASPESCLSHADGLRYWPQSSTLWKSRNTPGIDLAEYEALFSRTVGEEPERLARLTRYAQAECIGHRARESRERGETFVAARAFDGEFAYASAALVESDGSRRPAYWALRDAWKAVHAFLRMPLWASVRPGERASFAAALLRDNPLGAIQLRCEAFGMQGAPIASGTVEDGGEFSFDAPGESGVVLVRTLAEDAYGRLASRCDQLLCVTGGERPLEPLWNPPRTRLSRSGGLLTNEGPSVALAVSAGGYYGALLPGESVNLEGNGAFECLNAIL